jgi:GcrA cell cycle regulator
MSNTDWTPELIARLRELWGEGHSTAEIARRLGVSKNSIVGKSGRVGLDARPSPIKRGPAKILPPERAGRVTLPQLASQDTCRVSQPGSEVVAPARKPVVLKPVARAIVRAAEREATIIVPTIFKPRRSTTCCWPTGHGRSIVFCEEIAEPGRPYCKNHCAKAYTKIRNWGFEDTTADQPAA